MNTIPVIHLDQWVRREERVSLMNFNNSQTQLLTNQGQALGTQAALCSLVSERESGRGSAQGSWQALWLMLPLVNRCLARAPAVCPLSWRPGGHKAGKQACLHQSAQFQPDIYHTQAINEEFFTNSQPCLWGDDLLIFVWFLHPSLIEIHTASLAWLSLA